jgi:hypothetical protein
MQFEEHALFHRLVKWDYCKIVILHVTINLTSILLLHALDVDAS